MLSLYIHKKIEGQEHIPLLNYYLGEESVGVKRVGDDARKLFNRPLFRLVENPKEADYFLLPHNYFHIHDSLYIENFLKLSKEHQKKIIIFCYGDSDKEIKLPNSIIFRTSQYVYKKQPNEIIMPAIADDLLEGELVLRTKQEKPVVGFCGWASFESSQRAVIEKLKVMIIYLKSLFDSNSLYHLRGIIFRMKALNALSGSNLIKTNFIIRKSFSGNEKTIKMDPIIARQEYVENILNSDLSLAVKGDGNFSIRFYEVLSLGRIPILIDTNCILPLEDIVNYQDFVFRIKSNDIKNLEEKIAEFYKKLNNSEFQDMQKKARSAFETYLRADRYFKYVLNKDFLKKY